MLIGIADTTFLAEEDFKILLESLSPHFQFGVSYELTRRLRLARSPLRYYEAIEEREKFMNNRLFGFDRRHSEKLLKDNIKWGLKSGNLLTVRHYPYHARGFIKDFENAEQKRFLYEEDFINILLAQKLDVPLWGDKGIIESITDTYPSFFKKISKTKEVDIPIEKFSEDSLNPVDQYLALFSDLQSMIKRRIDDTEKFRKRTKELGKTIREVVAENRIPIVKTVVFGTIAIEYPIFSPAGGVIYIVVNKSIKKNPKISEEHDPPTRERVEALKKMLEEKDKKHELSKAEKALVDDLLRDD